MNTTRVNEQVTKMVCVMEVLMTSHRDISVREIADRCRTSKSSIHRLLLTMKEFGWVYQDEETKNYRIGVRFLALADEWRGRLPLVQCSAPVMRDLVAEIGQTTLLSVIGDEQVICLHKCESQNALKMVATVGKKTPLTAAATGKLLLAFASTEFRERLLSGQLPSFTPATITDPVRLRREMEHIRDRGYSTSFEELDPGAGSIAVPVYSVSGEVIAALTVAGPRFDFDDGVEDMLPAVQRAGGRITAELKEKSEVQV